MYYYYYLIKNIYIIINLLSSGKIAGEMVFADNYVDISDIYTMKNCRYKLA